MNNLGYIHTKNRFTEHVPQVTWDDVINQLASLSRWSSRGRLPGIGGPYVTVFNVESTLGSIERACEEVFAEEGVTRLDIYSSLTTNSKTFGGSLRPRRRPNCSSKGDGFLPI